MGRWRDGWTDTRIDRWIDGRMDGYIERHRCPEGAREGTSTGVATAGLLGLASSAGQPASAVAGRPPLLLFLSSLFSLSFLSLSLSLFIVVIVIIALLISLSLLLLSLLLLLFLVAQCAARSAECLSGRAPARRVSPAACVLLRGQGLGDAKLRGLLSLKAGASGTLTPPRPPEPRPLWESGRARRKGRPPPGGCGRGRGAGVLRGAPRAICAAE